MEEHADPEVYSDSNGIIVEHHRRFYFSAILGKIAVETNYTPDQSTFDSAWSGFLAEPGTYTETQGVDWDMRQDGRDANAGQTKHTKVELTGAIAGAGDLKSDEIVALMNDVDWSRLGMTNPGSCTDGNICGTSWFFGTFRTSTTCRGYAVGAPSAGDLATVLENGYNAAYDSTYISSRFCSPAEPSLTYCSPAAVFLVMEGWKNECSTGDFEAPYSIEPYNAYLAIYFGQLIYDAPFYTIQLGRVRPPAGWLDWTKAEYSQDDYPSAEDWASTTILNDQTSAFWGLNASSLGCSEAANNVLVSDPASPGVVAILPSGTECPT